MTNSSSPIPQKPANEVKPDAPAVPADKPEQKKAEAATKA